MRTQTLMALLGGLLCASAWAQQPDKGSRNVPRGLTIAHARRHVAFLADDKLGGRLPGTAGCRKAADVRALSAQAVAAHDRQQAQQRVTAAQAVRGQRGHGAAT